jgi:ubiquinone/menaquinone biosynthesis C-methylase UbiE
VRPPPVDYDAVAPAYDQRYDRNKYEGVRDALLRFVEGPSPIDVAEIGCGTGHWLVEVGRHVALCAGLDLSWGMLSAARVSASSALLVRGSAAQLPWRSATFDRVFCVNALHHFADRAAFAREARRILRPGGGVFTVGLDPHTGEDRWWVYDYFAGALAADRARYPSTETVRALLAREGFVNVSTRVVQHFPYVMPFRTAVARGQLDRRSTSQLMVISDADYEAGLARLRDEEPELRADLRLYATYGWLPLSEKASYAPEYADGPASG